MLIANPRGTKWHIVRNEARTCLFSRNLQFSRNLRPSPSSCPPLVVSPPAPNASPGPFNTCAHVCHKMSQNVTKTGFCDKYPKIATKEQLLVSGCWLLVARELPVPVSPPKSAFSNHISAMRFASTSRIAETAGQGGRERRQDEPSASHPQRYCGD